MTASTSGRISITEVSSWCLSLIHILFSAKKKANKYLFEPFPSKDELLDKYEAGLDSPYEDLSDIDNLSDEEQSTIITEPVSYTHLNNFTLWIC